jgi:hypothetical protein
MYRRDLDRSALRQTYLRTISDGLCFSHIVGTVHEFFSFCNMLIAAHESVIKYGGDSVRSSFRLIAHFSHKTWIQRVWSNACFLLPIS